MVSTSDPGSLAPAFQAAAAAASNQSTSRTRFYVEMKPGETTCVSWRKLMKDFLRTNPSHSEPPLGAHPALQARIAPEVVLQKDPLPPPANRFNSVIEKIERIYKGEDSADENDMLNDLPDDDQYDTEDSFIDDRELNEYFSVDKEKLKHEGFFINKGKLERENEAVSLTTAAPKKRKRRDIKKLGLESEEAIAKQKPHKGMRLKAPRQSNVLTVAGLSDSSDKDAFVLSSQIRATKFVKKDSQEFPRMHETASFKDKAKDRPNNQHVSKCGSAERLNDRDSIINREEAKLLKDFDSTSSTKRNNYKEKESGPKDAGALVPCQPKSIHKISQEAECKDSMTVTGGMQLGNLILSSTASKDVSPVRSKSTALERAIQDLERGVAQFCPPSLIVGEAEQGKRNRLPQDIKQKLAKIARLAAKQGKLTDVLIDRLMDILGHIMRVKTLKRNLKEMIEIGLSDMREKEGRLQDIKREVTEMVKSRVHSLQTQDVEQDLSSDDFQARAMNAEKPSTGGRYKWDNATEDKICDLYEQYLEGMDEHKGPQIRKLYGELAELWPNGWMDNNGIKNAVQRAKDRKKKQIKANNVGSDIKRRQRHSGKQIESDVERFPLLDLNLPGTDHSSYDKAKCCTVPEANLGNQLPSSSGVRNHHLIKKSNIKNLTCMEKKKIEGNPLLKKKVKRQLEKSVMDALGSASHGKLMTFEAPYWKMGIQPLVSLPTHSLQQNGHLLQSETSASDHAC